MDNDQSKNETIREISKHLNYNSQLIDSQFNLDKKTVFMEKKEIPEKNNQPKLCFSCKLEGAELRQCTQCLREICARCLKDNINLKCKNCVFENPIIQKNKYDFL